MLTLNTDPSPAQLRQFAGLWFPAFCALAGYLLYAKAQQPQAAYAVWAVAGVLAAAGLLVPAWIKPVYLGMLYATFPIGWVVSHLLLAAIFYLVLTPIGLLLRLCGHDPLTRPLDRSAKSYWKPRGQPADNPRYFKQY